MPFTVIDPLTGGLVAFLTLGVVAVRRPTLPLPSSVGGGIAECAEYKGDS